jgi:hypothetical protein
MNHEDFDEFIKIAIALFLLALAFWLTGGCW